MKNFAISRRYAKALMLIAKEDGLADQYKEELNDFAELLGREKKLESALCNPLYGKQERKKVLQNVIGQLGLSRIMTSFLLLLFDKGRIEFIFNINEYYQKLVDELNGIARASLVSATELSLDATSKVQQALSKRTGKDIILSVKQDASLIGGIVTKIGDLVLDGSIRTQLQRMRESFKRGESV